MSAESKIIEDAKRKAQRDARRKYSFMDELPNVNENLECVLLLGRLNEAIELLSELQDPYYTEYIWNSGTDQGDALKKAGLDEDYFYETELKLAQLRMILVGSNVNYDGLYRSMYDSILGHEVYWKEFFEERTKKLEAELERLRRKKEG